MTNKQFSRRTKFMSQKQWLYEAVRGKIQKSSYVVIRYVSGASPGRLAGCGLKPAGNAICMSAAEASPGRLAGCGLKPSIPTLIPCSKRHHPAG